MMRLRTLAIALAAGSLSVTATLAQPAPGQPGPATPNARPAPAQQRAIASIAAQQLARAALIDFRSIPGDASGPADARYLTTFLRDAAALDPTNPFILRYAIDAASQSGDQQAVLSLSRSLVALDPEDTSAQLAFIRARVATCQSVEERLTILDSFLGPRGDSLEGSVRSRLAIDAALLRREIGDAAGFVKDLTAAITFDSANPSAAALALDYYSSRMKKGEGQFELLANTLLAAPLDATLHAAIAGELAGAGATDQAIRFYDNARNLYIRQNEAMPSDEQARRLIQVWRSQGPQVVIKQLNDAVDGPRREAQVEIDIANATGKPIDKLRKPADVRHPLAFERLRLAAAFAAADRSTLDRSLADYTSTVEAMAKDDPGRAAAMAEAAYLKALINSGDLNRDLANLRLTAGVAPESILRVEAWAKLRSGNSAAGRALFEKMSNDPLATLALLAVDVESTPVADTAQSRAISDRLAALANDNPASPVSAWAYTTYQLRNGGQSPPPAPRAEKYTAMGAGIPAWLDEIAKEPSRYVNVRAETVRTGLSQLEPAVINLRITNNTPVPLAIGTGMTIDDQLLVISTVDIGGAQSPELGRSEVATLGGRLRLLPRESVVFPVWADPGFGGWAIQNVLTKAVRSRYSVVLGYRIVDGMPRPGPFGTTIEAGPIGRSSLPLGDYAPVVTELATLQDADLGVALLHARLLLLSREKPLTVEQAKSLVTAIGDRYRRATAAERIAILMLTPTPRMSGATIDLERVLAQIDETDPAVIRAALLARVDDASSPLLVKYRANPDAGVQEAIKLIESRLATDRPCFSRAALAAPAPAPKPPAPASATPAAPPTATPPTATPPPAAAPPTAPAPASSTPTPPVTTPKK